MWFMTRQGAQCHRFYSRLDALHDAYNYLSYDLSIPITVEGPNKTYKYDGEAGLTLVKIQLGMIPVEDLILYTHTSPEVDEAIAERMRE